MTTYEYSNLVKIEADDEKKYHPYLKSYDKSVLTLELELGTGEVILFPYSHFHPMKIAMRKANYFTFSLLGGGLSLVLHMKNFDWETYNEFCQALAKHEVERIFEFSGDEKTANFPFFSRIDEVG